MGIDFLESSGIALNFKWKTWFLSDSPKRPFHFVEQIQESKISLLGTLDSNGPQMAALVAEKENDHPCD